LSIEKGAVRGTTRNNLDYFYDIPFAAPPIGKNRFRPPQPATPWSGVLDARTQGGVMCPQIHSVGPFVLGDEDCLYLDVYRPAGTNPGDNLPIMVWLYGGGYIAGDKYEFGLYDATHLVNTRPHIHIAMNYRVGVLGFFAHNDLFAESNTTGNYGLQDQQAALRWVQANAYALGGDSTRVTIFGESAGAFSVCWHLVSPTSKGLFSAAIGESGDCDSGPFFRPLALASNFSIHYANSVGCAGPNLVKCMRQLTTDAVFNGDLFGAPLLAPIMPWAAVVDGSPLGLADIPLTLIKQNSSLLNRVPYMTGTNNNEGVIFLPGLPLMGFLLPLTKSSMTAALMHLFNNKTLVSTAMAMYDHYDTYEDTVSAMLRDWFFVCPTRQTAAAWNEMTGQPVYMYHWTFLPDNWIDTDFLGDYHASELFILYHNSLFWFIHPFDARDDQMSDAMQKYWTSFAEGHSPNGAGVPFQWPQYNATTRANLRLDLPLVVERNYKDDICTSLWDNVPPQPW
jgi:para-nitrobenzyl esterase